MVSIGGVGFLRCAQDFGARLRRRANASVYPGEPANAEAGAIKPRFFIARLSFARRSFNLDKQRMASPRGPIRRLRSLGLAKRPFDYVLGKSFIERFA
jgi:hypothetical protein